MTPEHKVPPSSTVEAAGPIQGAPSYPLTLEQQLSFSMPAIHDDSRGTGEEGIDASNNGDGASSSVATDTLKKETFQDLSNANLDTHKDSSAQVQGRPESKRKRKDSNENADPATPTGEEFSTTLSSAQSILLRRSKRAKANSASAEQAPSAHSVALHIRATKECATLGKGTATATGRKQARGFGAPEDVILSRQAGAGEDDWLPAFVPSRMRYLTRDTLDRKWAKHVNDLTFLPKAGSICGYFSKEEHRICDLLCIVAGIPLKPRKCLKKLPNLEEVEVELQICIPVDLKETWHRVRGVPLPQASFTAEDETGKSRPAASAATMKRQSLSLSPIQAPSSVEGTTANDLGVDGSTNQLQGPGHPTSKVAGGDISPATTAVGPAGRTDSPRAHGNGENFEYPPRKGTVNEETVLESAPALVETRNDELAETSLEIAPADTTTEVTSAGMLPATVQQEEHSSTPSTESTTPSTPLDVPYAHPVSGIPSSTQRSQSIPQTGSGGGIHTLVGHPLNVVPSSTASQSVPSIGNLPQSAPIHLAPQPATTSANRSALVNLQPSQAQPVPINHPIFPITSGNFNHTSTQDQLVEVLEPCVRTTGHLPSHINGIPMTDAWQSGLSRDLYEYRINLALIEGLQNSAAVRAMVLATNHSTSQTTQLSMLAQALGGAGANGVPLYQCGWKLELRGLDKCQTRIPMNEEAVKLHFQMAHSDVKIWSQEKQKCDWGTHNQCKSRLLGTNLLKHGVKFHLGPNAPYPV